MHIFSYTQHHYSILPCGFQATGRIHCLKQNARVKSFPCAVLERLAGELVGDSRIYHKAEVQTPVRTPLATSFGLCSHR